MERTFRRISEAHTVLSDPDRRKAYDAGHPDLFAGLPEPEAPSREPESPERMAERQARLARHPYLFKGNKVRELMAGAKAAGGGGDHARAVSLLNQAVALEPTNREIATALTQSRRQADAARFTQEMERAAKLEADGDLPAALSQYRIAANVDLKSAPAAAKCAQMLLKSGGDLKEAKGFAQRAADLHPSNADYRVLLGRILLQAEMKKLAKKEFEEAAKLDPNNADAKAHLKKMRWPF
jgi:tetratricopeptide (TPR) repeat protein